MNIAKEVHRLIMSAFFEAKEQHHEFVTPEHLLYSVTMTDEGADILTKVGVNLETFREILKKHITENVPTTSREEVLQSFQFQRLMTLAAGRAVSSGRDMIELSDMLISLYDYEESFAAFLLSSEGIEQFDIIKVVAHSSPTSLDDGIPFDEDDDDEIVGIDLGLDDPDDREMIEERFMGRKEKDGGNDHLAFLLPWTKMAQNGEFEPFIGRDNIIKRVEQILLRKTRHNPLLIGDPGVGKTAIVEGLTQYLASGDVPKPLKDFSLYRLDLAGLVAGTQYRGDFEQRLKTVVTKLEQMDKVIVFIDEFHNIIGAGATSNGSMDASNLLKPLLSRSDVRVIGATTDKEYRKHIETDPALVRRMQLVSVPEPTQEETKKIITGIISRFEEHHAVDFEQDSIDAAINLSAQHISDRSFPDKAIDVIDEAGAANRMKKRKLKKIGEKEIAETLSIMTGIPVKNLSRKESSKLKMLEKALAKQIFGQKEAIATVVAAVKRSRAGFSNPDKPTASMLFVGPTGVGKTALTRTLSDTLGIPLIRFDMSEYQEKHSIAKLFGSPPGYVGYDEGGLLTDKIRSHPHAVLLLDEIEKAHGDIFNALLQIMDYGTLTDSKGKKADFRNVIIIMTSNAGARDISKSSLGFGKHNQTQNKTKEAVERLFSPEFRNRLDRTVFFNSITPAIMNNVIKKFIRQIAERLLAKKVKLSVSPSAITHLAKLGFSAEFGAREAERLVTKELEKLLTDALLFGELKEGGSAIISLKKGQLTALFS
ncbi:AAA family ATPase [bacterium]|nr:AAA family ATPase [bacterium]